MGKNDSRETAARVAMEWSGDEEAAASSCCPRHWQEGERTRDGKPVPTLHAMPPKKRTPEERAGILSQEAALVALSLREAVLSEAERTEQVEGLYGIVQDLMRIQKADYIASRGLQDSDDERLDIFLQWCRDNGLAVDDLPCEVRRDPDMGYGMFARRDIAEGELLVEVPEQLMFHQSNCPQSAHLVDSNLCRDNPSVGLAFMLWAESMRGDSFWKPYIAMLPEKFDLPLFWTLQEVLYVTQSHVRGDILNMLCAAVVQYNSLREWLQANDKGLAGKFTFEGWLWSVCAVLSRQNQIMKRAGEAGGGAADPDGGGDAADVELRLVLIPYWDLFNHAAASERSTTHYDVERDVTRCEAPEQKREGEQVLLFYGARPNDRLLLYSGFVDGANAHTRGAMTVRLAAEQKDPLRAAKDALLMANGVNPAGSLLEYSPHGVSPAALGALRGRSCDADELRLLRSRLPTDSEVSLSNELRTFSVLRAIFQDAVSSYPSMPPFVEGTSRKRYELAEALHISKKQTLESCFESICTTLGALKKREKNRKKKASKKKKEAAA